VRPTTVELYVFGCRSDGGGSMCACFGQLTTMPRTVVPTRIANTVRLERTTRTFR